LKFRKNERVNSVPSSPYNKSGLQKLLTTLWITLIKHRLDLLRVRKETIPNPCRTPNVTHKNVKNTHSASLHLTVYKDINVIGILHCCTMQRHSTMMTVKNGQPCQNK